MNDVVHRPQGELVVEEVTEQLDDGAVGAMADQHQGQDQLPQPGPGHGQVEQDVVGRRWGVEGLIQGERRGVDLLIEELATDLMLPRQFGDRLRPGEDLHGELLPPVRPEPLGRPGRELGQGGDGEVQLRRIERGRSLRVHACFLRVGRGIESPAPTWRRQVFEKTPLRSPRCYPTLNQAHTWDIVRDALRPLRKAGNECGNPLNPGLLRSYVSEAQPVHAVMDTVTELPRRPYLSMSQKKCIFANSF